MHISNVYKIDIFYSEMILYQFTSEWYDLYHFTVAKNDFWQLWDWYIFQKSLSDG